VIASHSSALNRSSTEVSDTLLGLARQDFLSQEIQHVTVCSRKVRHELLGVAMALQRQGGEL